MRTSHPDLIVPWSRHYCEHGSNNARIPARGPTHRWTHIYWPSGLFASLALFFVPYYGGLHWTSWGLLAGAVILGVPELLCFATGNSQDTLSDWVWNSCHVTGTNPINKWNAEHYLLACVHAFISVNATYYLWDLNWRAGLASGLFSTWLLFHFWGRWFT
jgi:hypothetical protein